MLSAAERDTLLVNMITYMDAPAPGATSQTRFEPRFRPYYQKRLSLYTLEEHQVVDDSLHYFFVVRPVAGSRLYQRGVGGRFSLKEGTLQPAHFEEMWCTPHFKDSTLVRERGGYLFKEMVQKGTVAHLLGMKHYLEWPDSTLVYDQQAHEWVATKKAK
ncbi:hypothetical protein GCM10027275_01400 [Rhabdobacter roseus]